jgi:hypothetical protein
MYRASTQLSSLLGGWNRQSQFVRAGVREGDAIYPVHVARKRLYLLARIMVDRIEHDDVTERVFGMLGSGVSFDLTVPPETLSRWRFASGRQIKFLVEGDLTRSNSFQGIYQLSPETASELFGLLLDHREASDSPPVRSEGDDS